MEIIEVALDKSLAFLKQSRLLKWMIAVLVVAPMGYLLLPVLANGAAQKLIREDQLTKADIVIALAGDAVCKREKKAVELYQQGWAKKIIVGGAQIAWGIHTADAAKRYVTSLGVPEADVLTIRDTWNTRVEAAELEKLMLAKQWRSAIVVTSAFHSRRAMFTIEHAAEGFVFISSPVSPGAPEWQPDRWWSRRKDMSITIREFISWANTLAGGWQ